LKAIVNSLISRLDGAISKMTDKKTFPQEDADPFLAQEMTSSRLAFADRETFEKHYPNQSPSGVPFCAICTAISYTLVRDVRRDLTLLDKK